MANIAVRNSRFVYKLGLSCRRWFGGLGRWQLVRIASGIDQHCTGRSRATAGDRVDAERILNELLTRASEEYVGPTIISWIYANLDQSDRAFEWLRKACSEHDCTLAFGISCPIYDRISGDSRFHEVVRRVHLG